MDLFVPFPVSAIINLFLVAVVCLFAFHQAAAVLMNLFLVAVVYFSAVHPAAAVL